MAAAAFGACRFADMQRQQSCHRQATTAHHNNNVPTLRGQRGVASTNGRNAMTSRFVGMAAAAALGLAVCPQGAMAQSLKDQIIGAWAIVSQVQTLKDGSTNHPSGPNPKGLNVFTADGQFVVLFMRDELPKLASGNRQKATAEEARAIVGGSIGYFGTYTVDEPNKTIVYRIVGTTFPNQLGLQQRRVVTYITANELKYRNPGATSGGQIEVTFKRAGTPRS
jgi:hypothetical protein